MTGLFGPAKKKRKGVSASMREEILLDQDSCCNKCGEKFSGRIRPQYDHKDGDRSNNKKSNIQALCAICHDQKSRRQTKRRVKSEPERNDFGLGDLSFGLGPTTTSKRKKKKKSSDDFGLGDLSFGL